MKRKIIIGLIVLLIVIVIAIMLLGRSRQTKTSPYFGPTPTPIPITYNKQNYSDSGQHYTIAYPQEWVQQPSDGIVTSFAYTEGDKTYTFDIIPPVGNTIPDMTLSGADKIDTQTMYYGGKQFIKRIYKSQGKPILLVASPSETDISFYNFSMELPPTNTDKYMQIFDQILTNMQINKNFDPNDVLSITPPPDTSTPDQVSPTPDTSNTNQ